MDLEDRQQPAFAWRCLNRYLEISGDYAGIAVVSNWGAGVSDELISEDDIAETLREPMTRVRALIRAVSTTLAEQERT